MQVIVNFFAGMKASTYSRIIYPSFHQSEIHPMTDQITLPNPAHYARVGTACLPWFCMVIMVLHICPDSACSM